jgi:prepilin-type processing-associated H-X9-DG protein
VSDYSVIRNVETNLYGSFPGDVDVYTEATRWGAFSYNSGSNTRVMRWASVLDGLSNTLFYCEDAGRPALYLAGKRRTSSTVGGSAWSDEASEFGLNGCTPSATSDVRHGEPYSFHTSGINVGLCDGSVRFIRESITSRVFARLVTAEAGEIVDDF